MKKKKIKIILSMLDCKTVGFFSKSGKKSLKRGVRVLWARSAQATQARRACEARAKKPSLPSLALCFQPRCRPFVWLLARPWIRKNTDCFAVYIYAIIIRIVNRFRFFIPNTGMLITLAKSGSKKATLLPLAWNVADVIFGFSRLLMSSYGSTCSDVINMKRI